METRKLIKIFIIVLLLAIRPMGAFAQDRFDIIETKLKELLISNLGLNEKVELSVNNTSLQEFIRALGTANNLNISVDPSLKITVVHNFSNVTVSDVILFLAKKYDLDVTFIGNIMSFSPHVQPPLPAVIITPKKINVTYDKSKDILGLDLKADSLYAVAKEITTISGKNVIIAPGTGEKTISGFIQNLPFESALEKLAFANDLKLTVTEDKAYLIEKKEAADAGAGAGKTNKGGKGTTTGTTQGFNTANLEVKVTDDKLTVNAINTPLLDVIGNVSQEAGKHYFLFSEPKGNATLSVKDVSYDEFLNMLLNGTDFTFKKEGDIYLLGDRNLEGLRATKVVQLQNRTIDKVIDFIPADLKKNVDLKLFPDLNSIILSGSAPRITEIETFIRDLDKKVPVIMIEVIIVDVKKNHNVSTGIKAGLKDKPATTGGDVYPGVDFNFSAKSLNNMINLFNGFGVFNLGKVTPNFYLSIKALEEQGVLKTRSTPKLATLNGHEAKMSIGKTEYYLELSNSIIGGISAQTIVNQQYKSVNADLALTINPVVSGDEYITLDVKLQQSDFTGRISPNAPPGTVKRDFQSLIRVRDQEMIILGGLEEESANNTGSGIPILSRIPVIKWLFSSRTKTKSKSRLNIFIKPTVIY